MKKPPPGFRYRKKFGRLELAPVRPPGRKEIRHPAPTVHRGKNFAWRLRDPKLNVHVFTSLFDFVRRNGHLFHPRDLVWQKHRGCEATSKLRRLKPGCKHGRTSWHGWRWAY